MLTVSGNRLTNLLDPTTPGSALFLTEHGSVGMEFAGRIAVKSIQQWIALAFGDLPEKPKPAPLNHPGPGPVMMPPKRGPWTWETHD